MLTKITLIRHGQTQWNHTKRYLGHTDIDLDATGKEQALRTQKKLKREEFHKIYSSDLKRAANFAKIVFKGKEIFTTPDLRELNFGLFEGKTHDEIMNAHKYIYSQWLSSPFKTTVPDGEQLKDFKQRITNIFKKIIADNSGLSIGVVTHAGPIRIILNHVMNKQDIWEPLPKLASIHIVEHDANIMNIVTFNDTTHLTNLLFL
ncbi:MAG: histidine phosphatase family protein [Candidatus Omnitrophota bacterium]